jgi:hypothetical protein
VALALFVVVIVMPAAAAAQHTTRSRCRCGAMPPRSRHACLSTLAEATIAVAQQR